MKLTATQSTGPNTGKVLYTLKRPLYYKLSKSMVFLNCVTALSMLCDLVNPVTWLWQSRALTVKNFSEDFKSRKFCIRRKMEWRSWDYEDINI